MTMTDPLWQPSDKRIADANLTAFMQFLSMDMDEAPSTFEALLAWSVDRTEDFWSAFWRFSKVTSSKAWNHVLTDPERMPGAKWFDGARLNFAENMLRRRDDHPAIVAWTEDRQRRSLSYGELYLAVAKLAAALKADGVGVGDRVAAVMPHTVETIVAMLAATSIGAVWSSCSPDFGKQGLLDRFGQIEPKVLIAIDGYRYNGKPQNIQGEAQASFDHPNCSTLQPHRDGSVSRIRKPSRMGLKQRRSSTRTTPNNDVSAVAFEQLPFDHPGFHPLLVRHDRRAQGDRAWRGRHAPAAPEGA